MLYVFKSLKGKPEIPFEKPDWKSLKSGLSWGKNGRYAICDAILASF